jgi:hypothetical protein
MSVSAFALTGGQVTITRATAPYFISDSNNGAGPRAAYIGVKIRNTSATDTLFGIQIGLDSIVGNSLFRLIGPADSTLIAGKLNPLDSSVTYFYVKYPINHALTATFHFNISDNKSGTVSFNTSITTRSALSSNAGGLLISNKIAYYDALGTILHDTVIYQFNNVQVGDEIEFQPNGDTLFKADKVQLLNCIVVSSMLSSVPAGTKDKLYYVAASGTGGSGNTVKVVYSYKNLLFNDSTTLNPYAGTTSGASNYKFSGNYGANTSGFATTANSIRTNITKTSSCGICNPCDTITYTINVTNSFSQILQVDQLVDVLPLNYKYMGLANGSEVTLVNSSQFPLVGDSGTITFSGFVADTIFPYESYKIYPGDTLSLKYKALTRCISSGVQDTNRVFLKIADFTTDTAFAVTCAGCSALPVDLVYFYGNVEGDEIKLQWATASESQSSHFNVFLKSPEGKFNWVGAKQAAGESMQLITYHLTDRPQKLETYLIYRLDQIDFNGRTKSYYTHVKRGKISQVILFPNPVDAGRNITVINPGNWIELQVTDAVGKTIIKKSNVQGNDDPVIVPTLGLKTGLYYIQIIDSNRNSTFHNIHIH